MIKNQTNNKKIIIICSILLSIIILAGVVVFAFINDTTVSKKLSVEESQSIVDGTFKKIAKNTADGSLYIIDNTKIVVESVSYGNEKDVILQCSYTTKDVKSCFENNKQTIIDDAYKFYFEESYNGKKVNATKVKNAVSSTVKNMLHNAATISGNVTLYIYEVENGIFSLFLSDEVVDLCTGGIISSNKIIDGIKTANYGGQTVDITNNNTIRTGIKDYISLTNYDSKKPDTGNFITKLWNNFAHEFNRNFVEGGKWKYLINGLGTTLAITGVSGVIGMILGFLVAIIRCTNESTGKFVFVDKICRVYLTVVRGTPVMVQLLIIYFVILLPIGVPKFLSAVICFGLNSGAYVAEIVRGGIMSIDKGQNEAGRSLGFNFSQTMIHFIIPQAFKAVLPSLANEFITLLKESSVAFYIGVADLTQGGLKIRSITYSSFMPLIAVALIYLAIVLILTKLVGILERRLRKSDH